MFNLESYWDETLIRSMIVEYLNNSYVAESINYIHKILDEAYQSGITYDVSDLQPEVFNFALQSSNKAEYCVNEVSHMHFISQDLETVKEKENRVDPEYDMAPIIFFDVESYPGDENNEALFVVCWKFQGKDKSIVQMINPSAKEVQKLFIRILCPSPSVYNAHYD